MASAALAVLECHDAGDVVLLCAKRPLSRRHRIAVLPLWPLDLAQLLVVPLSASWQAQPLAQLSFARGIEVVLSRWPMSRRVFLLGDSIEMLSFRIGAEGGRRVSWRMCARARSEVIADFEVDDVDTHAEAMALAFRIAHALGCHEYIARQEGTTGIAVELLMKPARAAPGSVYRRSARVPDARDVPREVVLDHLPRQHARFEEPEGFVPEPIDEAQAERWGVRTWEPGTRVIFGDRPRRWPLLLLPLLPLAWLVLTMLSAIVLGMLVGVCLALVMVGASLLGIDLSWLLSANPLYYAIFALCALGSFIQVGGHARSILRNSLATNIVVDWRAEHVRCEQFAGSWRVPLSHVDGLALRGGRLYLLLQERDVRLARGGDGLASLAVELARRLDVPVSLE